MTPVNHKYFESLRMFILPAVLILFCGLNTTGAMRSNNTLHPDSLKARIAQSQPGYQTLSARARVTWSDGTEETSFQTGIRMKRDSLVWMSLSSSGLEGARLLILPDSMRVMNQLAGITSSHDLSYLQFWLPFPVSFSMLQQFISGQRLTIGERESAVAEEDSLLALHTESDTRRETTWVDKQNYTLKKILLKDKLMQQSMEIIFESYSPLHGKPFSFKRIINIQHGPASIRMTIDITKAKMNEDLIYPFDK